LGKWKKFSMIVICSIVMCMTLFTLLSYSTATGMYIFELPYPDLLLANDVVATLVIWFNACMFLFFLIMVFVITCYPKKMTKLKFKKNGGVLLIDRKGIKGFILSSLKEEKVIKDPSIHIKMTKKKIHVAIKGKIGVTSEIYGRIKEWEYEMEEQIKMLVGSEVGIRTKVILKAYADEDARRVG